MALCASLVRGRFSGVFLFVTVVSVGCSNDENGGRPDGSGGAVAGGSVSGSSSMPTVGGGAGRSSSPSPNGGNGVSVTGGTSSTSFFAGGTGPQTSVAGTSSGGTGTQTSSGGTGTQTSSGGTGTQTSVVGTSAGGIGGHGGATGLVPCTVGIVSSCNRDPISAAIHGTCNPDRTCTCSVSKDPVTGLCF